MASILAPLSSLRTLPRRIPHHTSLLSSPISTASIARRKLESNDDRESVTMRTLAVVLKDQAEKQEQDDEIIQVEEETPPGKIKPFRLNVTLKPRDFTQSYRTAKAISFSKPRTVAPIAAKARRGDIFHQLDLNPLSFTTHPAILASFVSEMGLVYPRTITQLTPKNQRAISRAIRRAKMMGIIPSLSRPV